jgi:hypothetical protein
MPNGIASLDALACTGPSVPSPRTAKASSCPAKAFDVRSVTVSSRPSGLNSTWSASGEANPNPLSAENGVASRRIDPGIGVITPSRE